MLINLPELVLSEIGKELGTKDLFSLTLVHPRLQDFFNQDSFWKKHMKRHMWFERRLFRYQDDALFLVNNTPNRLHKIEQFEHRNIRQAIYSHDGSLLAVFANGCRLWVYRGEEEILHCLLSRKRNWDRIYSIEFSPDDKNLLVVGRKQEMLVRARGNEALVYRLNEDHATLDSFVNISPRMFCTWFDNEHVMFTQDYTTRLRMRLFLSSIDMAAEVLVYPILSFDTRVTGIKVAQHVSPRTRKITQIAEQAQTEGKTLNQKLFEIGMESGIDTNNMHELRAILDQETQCMTCYRLHSHHDAVSSRDCKCECHHNTDKLLIFHGNDDRVHIKIITQEMLETAKNAFLARGDNEEDPDQDRLFGPLMHCTHFDVVDHVYNTNYSLANSSMCLSPDHRYLYITGTRKASRPKEPIQQIKPACLDLETMVMKSLPDFSVSNWVEYDYPVTISANNDFVAIFTGIHAIIFSAFHRGNPVAVIQQQNGPISSVTLHPVKNYLAVTNGSLIHYYYSAEMAREEKDNPEED